MSLNIQHPEALALASDIAKRMDMSLADAVILSLREKLAQLTVAEDARRLKIQHALEISRACAATLDAATLAIDHGDLLCDDQGLPK